MPSSKTCDKYQKKYLPRRFAALCGGLAAALICAGAVCGQEASPAGAARQSGREPVRESDLRAFCPPAEFAEGAYAYKIYGKDGSLSYQAAIAEITRDCRFDGGKDIMQMHIAAAGRVVPGPAAARQSALTLPIEVKIARGGKILFAKTYGQRLAVGRFAAQFLLSEWVSVKKSEAVRGTKIFIGFAAAGAPPKRQKSAPRAAAEKERGKAAAAAAEPKNKQKPFADRLSPNAAPLTIPESF